MQNQRLRKIQKGSLLPCSNCKSGHSRVGDLEGLSVQEQQQFSGSERLSEGLSVPVPPEVLRARRRHLVGNHGAEAVHSLHQTGLPHIQRHVGDALHRTRPHHALKQRRLQPLRSGVHTRRRKLITSATMEKSTRHKLLTI